MLLRRIFGRHSNKQDRCQVAERFTSPVGAREWPEICSRGSRRKPSVANRVLLLVRLAINLKRPGYGLVLRGRTFRHCAGATDTHAGEIGRASCRERV